MNRSSIFFTITVSLIISILLVVISFVTLMTYNHNMQEKELFDRYIPIVKRVISKHHRGNINYDFAKRLEDLNYTMYVEKGSINAITYNPKTEVVIERKDKRRDSIFRVLKLDDRNYLYMKKRGQTILIRDNRPAEENPSLYIFLVSGIVIITIILMYLITLRKLMPLKVLKDKVSTLGDENFDFECCNLEGNDEVSMLAREFKDSALKLKNVKEARNIFIRNIMHELKTPITKGKFLAEIERNDDNDEKLKEVFNRLELLINEFASIEELISSTKNVEKNFYFTDDIIDNAKDILMIEDEKVKIQCDNKKLHVNFKLFSIAIKNLIDNGIKYSNDGVVIIKNENDDLIFENSGNELKYSLEKYFEPFFKEDESIKDSFGLGLYIVQNILKANHYTLEYEYVNGINRFICKKD